MLYNQRAIMAEIYTNRRLRLRQLIEERFEGNQSAMARAGGYRSHSFSPLLHATRTMGERSARQIEKALGLPDGWLDCTPPPGAVPTTPYKTCRGKQPKVRSVDDLLSAGYTQRQIARKFGVHESTVSRAVKRERAHRPTA